MKNDEMILMKVEDVILVLAWDPESFHRRVLELEAKGYLSRLESYSVKAEMNPETGVIIHLYSVEMSRSDLDAN